MRAIPTITANTYFLDGPGFYDVDPRPAIHRFIIGRQEAIDQAKHIYRESRLHHVEVVNAMDAECIATVLGPRDAPSVAPGRATQT